jgi:hypothetical protein
MHPAKWVSAQNVDKCNCNQGAKAFAPHFKSGVNYIRLHHQIS